MYNQPMLLSPVGKDYLWGGTRLKTEYNKRIEITPLAETWECSVHPDGPSLVASGAFKGQTLDKVIESHPEFLGSKASERGYKTLPILVKFIDAEKDLSVQVHPDDEYAREYENQNGKTEMWYVLDAKEGAKLVYGFEHNMTERKLKTAVETGQLSKHLHFVPIKKGDVFYIPAGTVHAICAGALIAEIQENSNVTYRVYDYNRIDKNGKPRELHFEKALQVMDKSAAREIRAKEKNIRFYPGCSREILCRCKYFDTERIQVEGSFEFSVYETSFQVLLCVEGFGNIKNNKSNKSMNFNKGECIFIPADAGRFTVQGNAELLKIRC